MEGVEGAGARPTYAYEHFIDAHVAMRVGVALAMAGNVFVSVHLWRQI